MKTTLKAISILCFVLALVFFLYSSVKLAKAEEAPLETQEVEPGIRMVQRNGEEEFAEQGLTFAAVLGATGLVLLLGSRLSSNKS